MSRALVFIAAVAAGLAVLATAPTVRAAGEIATVIVISQPEPITVGGSGQITVQLTTSEGAAVANEPIALTFDEVTIGRRWTDAAGAVAFNVPRGLTSGEYSVVADYAGDSTYLPASTSSSLSVVPYELTVETVPRLAGMPFELDGTAFVSGEDGVARIPVASSGEHELTVLAGGYKDGGRRAEFTRWGTEHFGQTITVEVPNQTPIQVGFDVLERASQRFVDPHGTSVDPARVTSFTLRSNVGTVATYPDGQARWFTTSRTVRRPNGLHSVPVRYILERVDVDGQNVVNTGQQRFLVKPDDEWEVELLLFTVRLMPHDALFGFPVGDAVTLSSPNGESARIPTEDGALTARWLARGLYRVSVPDAPGWSPITPVALSRDQEVELRVITYLDMAAVSLAALGLALGLLHLGRPHLIPRAAGMARGGVAMLRDPQAVAALWSRRQPEPATASPAMASPEASPAAADPPPRDFVLPHVRRPVHALTGAPGSSPASSGQGGLLAAVGGASALATPETDTAGRQPAGVNSKAEGGTRARPHAAPARASTTKHAAASTPQPEAASGRKGSGARPKAESTRASVGSRTETRDRAGTGPAPAVQVNGANGARVGSTAAASSPQRRSAPKRDASDGEARHGKSPNQEPSTNARRTSKHVTASTAQPEAASGHKSSGARPKTERTEPKDRAGTGPVPAVHVNGANGARGGSAAGSSEQRRSAPKRDAGNGEARRGQSQTQEPSTNARRTSRRQTDRSVRMRLAAVRDADRIRTWLDAIGISPSVSPLTRSGPAPEHATLSVESPRRATAPSSGENEPAAEPRCAGCGFILTNTARFCRRCGHDLDRDRMLQSGGAG